MKAIVTLNLRGTEFHLEDDAAAQLRRYIAALEAASFVPTAGVFILLYLIARFVVPVVETVEQAKLASASL